MYVVNAKPVNTLKNPRYFVIYWDLHTLNEDQKTDGQW